MFFPFLQKNNNELCVNCMSLLNFTAIALKQRNINIFWFYCAAKLNNKARDSNPDSDSVSVGILLRAQIKVKEKQRFGH